jgi:hypothetical protein
LVEDKSAADEASKPPRPKAQSLAGIEVRELMSELDEFLRAAPAIAILIFIIMAFAFAGSVRRYQTKIVERNLASNLKLEELRRRQIEVLERIAVALESKRDQSHLG